MVFFDDNKDELVIPSGLGNAENNCKACYDVGYQDGYSKGDEDGYQKGVIEGRKEGFLEGIADADCLRFTGKRDGSAVALNIKRWEAYDTSSYGDFWASKNGGEWVKLGFKGGEIFDLEKGDFVLFKGQFYELGAVASNFSFSCAGDVKVSGKISSVNGGLTETTGHNTLSGIFWDNKNITDFSELYLDITEVKHNGLYSNLFRQCYPNMQIPPRFPDVINIEATNIMDKMFYYCEYLTKTPKMTFNFKSEPDKSCFNMMFQLDNRLKEVHISTNKFPSESAWFGTIGYPYPSGNFYNYSGYNFQGGQHGTYVYQEYRMQKI